MDAAKEVRKGEELDWKTLEEYLRLAIPDLAGEFSVQQFHGGHANLTYLLTFGDREMVLRRPPFGKIAPGAHSMKREYKVLSSLHPHFLQAPAAYHFCDDESVIGAEFVVMERRTGVVVRTHIVPELKHHENVAQRLSQAMINAQAELHMIDVNEAGLNHLGKPDGFIHRQLEGWKKREQLCLTQPIPDMEAMYDLLTQDVPESQKVSVVHNDIKLDNCQFQPDNPDKVSSIFDWDMTTLGDPLADFASSLGYWPDPKMEAHNIPVVIQGDFPSKDELKSMYQDKTGFNLERIHWYEGFSLWKAAIITQQLYKRFHDGQTQDVRMQFMGHVSKVLSQLAREALS